jgi:protein-disulfide isomerase
MLKRHIAGALAALTLSGLAIAQTAAPAPSPSDKTKVVQPSASAPTVAPASPFPVPDPANFTADTPSVATINAFLKELWGYDPQRIWQVRAVQKTQVPGLSRVTILVGVAGGDPKQVQGSQFFVLPDGKHALADDVISFGPHPFAETREILKTRATGPAKGAAGKDLLFVEFSDFQCPHCKEAQAVVDRLMQDFPNARLVYENFPLRAIHPAAERAAEYGVCVAKSSGDAFYKYANAVFENQAALTPDGTTQALNDAATKAGVPAEQIATCVAQPQTKATVDESVKLAEDLNVNQTPTLFVNGRPVPVSASVPYDTTKSMVAYQLQLDGLPQPAPKLSSLSK